MIKNQLKTKKEIFLKGTRYQWFQRGFYISYFILFWISFGTFFPILSLRLTSIEYHLGASFFNPIVSAGILFLIWIIFRP
jgi:hypothetical protein